MKCADPCLCCRRLARFFKLAAKIVAWFGAVSPESGLNILRRQFESAQLLTWRIQMSDLVRGAWRGERNGR